MRIAIAVLAVALAGCGEAGDANEAGAANEAAAAECLTVPTAKVEWIASGLTVPGNASLRNARAVKSGVHADAYFVSADIEAPGFKGPGHVVTWFVTNLNSRAGIVNSVDDLAKEFTDWPDASKTAAAATMSDEGAFESRRCSEDAP